MNILQQVKYNRELLKFNNLLDTLNQKIYTSGSVKYSKGNLIHIFIERNMKIINTRESYFGSVSLEKDVICKLLRTKYDCKNYYINIV